MGGIGSGRYCHWSKATALESTQRIDIRYMRRTGLLRAGNGGTLSWNRCGEPAGRIGYTCWQDRIVFNYNYSDEPVNQTVYFERTPCRFGGERIWFRCPHCQRRCEVLSIAGKYPACRKCYRLPYQSQCEDRLGRLMRRQEKLEAMLWGDKRKWWRKAKRERLLAEFERVGGEYDDAFVQAAGNLIGDDEMRRILGLAL